jgi:hypothetical protein
LSASGSIHSCREHAAAETVVRVVGDLDSLVVAVVRDDRDDGAEDLFTGDRRLVGGDEQGRFDEPATRLAGRAPAAEHQAGAFELAGGDPVEYPLLVARDASGPIVVAGSNGLPMTSADALARSRSTTSSTAGRSVRTTGYR